jgi:hypothetical protein
MPVKSVSGFTERSRQSGAPAKEHCTASIVGRAIVCRAAAQKRFVRRSSAREKWRAAWRCRTSAQSRCLQATTSYRLPAMRKQAVWSNRFKSSSRGMQVGQVLLSLFVYILQLSA